MNATHIEIVQGSQEWAALRLAIPTASNFDRLVTPKTMKPSAAADGYLHELLAQWMIGAPLESMGGDSQLWMARGVEMEEEAASHYEWTKDVTLAPGGFFLRDDGMVGGSPDRLVGDDGLLEIKCPAAKGHVAYLLGDVAAEHRCQVQGLLWLSGRKWADVLSYSPVMPDALVRVERDEDFIAALSGAVDAFVARLLAAREEMLKRGYQPRETTPGGVALGLAGGFDGAAGGL